MKNYTTTYLASIIMFVLIATTTFGQVNTPAGATWPFGSRIQQFPTAPYSYGIIPGNLPSAGAYGKSQDAYDAYIEWKTCYAYQCSATQWRVRFDNANETVSEGIGYGMLLAAYAADKNFFDGLWNYYLAHLDANSLMNWRIGNGGASTCTAPGTVVGSGGATDGDLDVAMALIVAECQWPTATSPYDYAAQATLQISRIRAREISGPGQTVDCATGDYQLSNGDGWMASCASATQTCRNPSYQAPAYVKLFQAFDGGAPAGFWTNVYNTVYPLLNASRGGSTYGLVSNWSDPAGNLPGGGICAGAGTSQGDEHGYDAIRTPWRIVVDYLWNGEGASPNLPRTNFCQPISNYVVSRVGAGYGSPNNLVGPVTRAGTVIGSPAVNSTFTSMWGVATMGVLPNATNQSTLDFMYTRTKSIKETLNCTATSSTGYFGMTLRVVALFTMTGNFWKPCPPRCQAPTFASDSISTCGGTTVTLNPGLAVVGSAGCTVAAGPCRTFQWFKNGTSQGAASSVNNTFNVAPAAAPGWFRVKVDTVGGCSLSDSIYVSANAITPDLGFKKTLCANTATTLNSSITGTGYTFSWEYTSTGIYSNLAVLTGQTSSTLTNVRKAGLYKVTATKAGCTSLWDTVRVISSLASPQDACYLGAGNGPVTLSVTGTNLGPPSQYDWYQTNGTTLAQTGGLSYTTPSLAPGTYTYYVQDKARQYGRVGKAAPTGPLPANCQTSGAGAGMNGVMVAEPGADYETDQKGVYQQTFDVSRTINIDSVTVWYCLYGDPVLDPFTPANEKNEIFELRNSAGTAVVSGAWGTGVTPARHAVRVVPIAPASYAPYTGLVYGVRYYVGFNNVPAGVYRLTMNVPAPNTGNLLVEQHPTNVNYPYYDDIDGATVRITNTASIPYATVYSKRYSHFYDWTISAVNNCAKIPVVAYVGSGNCPAGLPIQLINFEGKAYSSFNKLAWATASEKNTNYFLIQRSIDNDGVYETIGKVQAAKNSNAIVEYDFVDRNAPDEGAYYRLEEYDLDGTKYYSNMIYINQYQSSDKISVFPNPANTSVTIRTAQSDSEFSSVELIDIYGKQLIIFTGNSTERNIDISSFQSGIYFVRVTFSGSMETIRLIKN
jgi:hypothetical protein